MGSKRFRALLLGLGLGAVLGALGLVTIRDLLPPVREIESEPSTLLAQIGESNTSERQLARVLVDWSRAPTVSSGTIAGRITSLDTDKRVLVQTDVVVEVDGIQRPALVAQRPLWRILTAKAEGDDVEAVARLMSDIGVADGLSQDRVVDDAFQAAVRRFEQAFDWPTTGEFKPEYVAWLPREPFAVVDVTLSAGDYLEAETLLMTGEATIVSANVVSLTADADLVLPAANVVFEIPNTLVAPLELDATITDPESLSALADFLGQPSASDAPMSLAERLRAEVADTGTGVVRLTTPRRLQTVPTASVVVDDNGRTCVISASGEALDIAVTGGVGGVTEVEPTLPAGLQVVVSPSEAEYSC